MHNASKNTWSKSINYKLIYYNDFLSAGDYDSSRNFNTSDQVAWKQYNAVKLKSSKFLGDSYGVSNRITTAIELSTLKRICINIDSDS